MKVENLVKIIGSDFYTGVPDSQLKALCNYLMATYKEKKSVMESQKAATQLNIQTQGDKDRIEAQKAADDLVSENKLKDLEVASEGIRAEFDNRNEKIGYKVREARQVNKVPYMLIIGKKEIEECTVSVRDRDTDQTTTMPFDEFLEKLKAEIESRD